MGIFISFVFLGLSLSAPLGPINFAQLDKGLKKGFFHAWLIGLGAMIAYSIFMIMVYLGLVHILELEFVKTFLWFFGSFVLVYTGIESVKRVEQQVNIKGLQDDSHWHSFFSGFLLSLSNPISILFWLGIYGSILAEAVTQYDPNQLLIYSSAILIGIMIWDVCMAGLASTFRKMFTTRTINLISLLSGLSLIGFGIYFLIEAIRLISS